MIKKLALLSVILFPLAARAASCPEWLNVDVKKLRSDETVNLCEIKQDKVLLIVNTASKCGFTPQFEGLEALYQKYKDQGFEVVGFPSDSFKQEVKDEAETAKICYVNYGVTFSMLSTGPVKGDDANPVFDYLGQSLGEPKWNFYKYLIGRDGNALMAFGSKVTPDSEELVSKIEEALN